MKQSNAIGLRRLLASMKDSKGAHAAILESLPLVSARKASIQLKLKLGSDRSGGWKRARKVGSPQEPV